MANGLSVKVDGLKELEAKFRNLAPTLGRNALRSAVSAAAEPIRKDAISRAPMDTGTLKRAIYKKQIREESSLFQQSYAISVRSGKKEQKKNRDAWYWRFIEFGTAKLAARPFLRPAIESKKQEAVDRFREKFRERLDIAASQK